MSHGNVKEISSAGDLDQYINSDKLTVIDFSAKWCGPCRMISPYFVELSQQSDFSNVQFLKIDVDDVEAAAQKYEVEAMPTFVFIKNGREIEDARLTGASKDRLLATLNKLK